MTSRSAGSPPAHRALVQHTRPRPPWEDQEVPAPGAPPSRVVLTPEQPIKLSDGVSKADSAADVGVDGLACISHPSSLIVHRQQTSHA